MALAHVPSAILLLHVSESALPDWSLQWRVTESFTRVGAENQERNSCSDPHFKVRIPGTPIRVLVAGALTFPQFVCPSPTISARLGNLMDSWVPYWQENTYWFSDGPLSKVKGFPPNLTDNYIDTGCDEHYTTGLLCKNVRMMVTFQQPEFMHYKWVLRVMDDTWVHMENLWDMLSTLDSSKPMVIGEQYCHPNFMYPTGGPGFVISRALINSFDFGRWHQITRRRSAQSVFDDLVWGQYLQVTNTPLIHHHGFSQLSASLDNSMFNYIISRTKWSLPFRPIAYHQGPHKFHVMPHLEDALHRLPYEDLDKKMMKAPECRCWPMLANDHEVRCTPKESIRRYSACGNGLKSIACLTGS